MTGGAEVGSGRAYTKKYTKVSKKSADMVRQNPFNTSLTTK